MNVTPLRASRRSTTPQQSSSRPGGRAATGDSARDNASLRDQAGQGASGRQRFDGSAALAVPLPEPSAEEARRPRLRLAPPLPVAAPRAPFVLLIVLLVVAGVLGILVLNNAINENVFQLKALQETKGQLDLREQQLNEEIALAESPGSLEAAAKRLGLVQAKAPAFILLPDGRIIGMPQPATGKPSITSQ